MAQYILAIDQGTTGSTALIVDSRGEVLGHVNHEFRQIYPKPGWVEHDAEEIWSSVCRAVRDVIQKTSIDSHSIAAIGITNQRETIVAWNKKSQEVLHNAIVWQDRRTADVCTKLKKTAWKNTIRKKTGLVIDPYFSATKAQWLLNNVQKVKEAAREQQLCFGTIDSFLLFRLTGGVEFKTDVSNASRTMLLNIQNAKWDAQLIKLFKIPETALPEVSPSTGSFGKTKSVPGLPDGIPITGIAGDQQSALFGQTCFNAGEAKCTYGTGSFILMNSGTKMLHSKYNLLTTIAWQLKKGGPITYALEGGAFVCGAAVQWLRDGLGLFHHAAEIEGMAKLVEDAGGVEFVPALTGLGAPYWEPKATGLITGLTRGSTRNHLARATLEGMALQNVDILTTMEADLKRRLKHLRVDGGACRNDLLMQLQADYLGVVIERPKVIETTSAGAAYLAGLGAGIWSDLKQIKSVSQIDKQFKPIINGAARTQRLKAWKKAIAKVLLQ